MVKKNSGSENIRVVVRCRDLLGYEAQRGDKALVRMDLATNQVVVQHLIGDADVFAFDAVYNNTFTQRDIFLQEVQPLADAVLQGYNATVFAYGQSGSGKTHTMTGNLDSRETYGMMPQVVDYLFSEIKKMTSATKSFKVKVSYVELYNGKSRDLLTRKQVNLEIKQNMAKNFYVKGAEMPEVTTFEEAMKQFNDGTERRKTASTDLNDTSSRSHALFTVQIEQFDFENDPSSPIVMTSKINVVDLAGSEKLSKTNATGDTAKEGCNINLSLSALATVIDTIVKGAKHIPYRGSPLTMLLKDSLGGNAKTVMFANVGPSDKNISETISTLRFALRAKQIENKPIKNMDPKDARIQDLMDQIEELKKRLGNVDLDVEDDLRQRIEELEVENSDLRAGGAEKNNVELEEQCRVLQSQLEQKEKAVHEACAEAKREQESRAVMESKYNFESSHMKDLKTMTINFIKRICTEEQLAQIKAQMPKDGSYNLKDDAWDVKEILFYLQGFTELYEHWRKNTYTKEDLEKYATRAMGDLQEQAQRQLLEATRANDELTRRLGEETKRRTADTESSAQLKVDLAALRDENAKLREKIERDQEKIKAKLTKTKEEQKALQDQLEATKAQLTEKDRDIARLKKIIEEGAGSGAGGSAAAMLGTAGDSMNGNSNNALTHQLERERRAREVLENRIKQTNVSLRRFGVCITDASAVDGSSGGGAAESTLQSEAQAFVLAAAEEKDIDGDVYGQLQQQVRTKQRLTELYHQQQMRLDDMIRKYECLKTGKPTPNFASASAGAGAAGTDDGTGPISTAPILQGSAATTAGGLDEATAQQVRDLLQSKEDELEKVQREKDAACDKLVKKLNKSDRRIKDLETQLDDERAQFADERSDITKELAELRGYNQQLALEVETARTQLTNAKEQYESVALGKDKEVDYLKDQVNELNNRIAETRNKTAELEETNRSYMRLQQQLQRAEATMAEMSENLENNRQMLKQSTHLLELEKTRNDELDQQVRSQELEMRRQDEAWRQEVAEQVNLTVLANNRRLEQQNQQFQEQLTDEQGKQKQLQKKLKSAKSNTQKAAQRYDEMILENESILSKLEELKVTSMKMYLEKQEAQRDLDAFRPTTNVRARAL